MDTKPKKAKKDKQLLALVLLMAFLLAIVVTFFLRFYHLERQGCVTRLQEHTETSGRQILRAVERSQSYLNKISAMVYEQCTTSPDYGRDLLASLGDLDMISRLELFMPNGTLYTASGIQRDPTLSYTKLAEKGTGVTRRAVDQLSPDRHIVRLYVPVEQNGQTVALLCGVVDVEQLGELFPVAAYDQQAKLYLMEGETGNYLIDPDHETPSNLRNVDSYLFTEGYSKEDFFRQSRTGASGFTVMRAPESNSNDYLYYTSVGFEDWMVMLSVKEDVAFAQSHTVFVLFVIMFLLIVVLSLVFMIFFFRNIRRQQARTELQLRGGQYMLKVQQILFRAHIDPEAFGHALDEVTDYLDADAAVYCALTGEGSLILKDVGGSASKVPPRKTDFRSFFPQLCQSVLQDGHFTGNRPFLWGEEDWRSARDLGIRNLLLIRLDTLDGKKPLGILGVVNEDVFYADTEPLDQVALTFTMAAENQQNYQTLAYISQVDELTGLMNRNSYQARLDELGAMDGGTVGCIYMDANGLHEINNHLGHDAGDEMLRSVADALLASFEKKDAFRLGGDEFAVLVTAMPQEELNRKAKAVSEAVEKCGYTVSVGVEWQRGELQVSTIVAAAEANMRKAKAEFYASKGGERQMRNLNTRLEQTLSAKRDADTLLSFLAPNLLGVYFVDPEKDTCRYIVAPPYFEEALKQTGHSFQSAMELYIRDYVHPDDQQLLRDRCSYDVLQDLLKHDGAQELRYKKNDGTYAMLKIRRPSRAGDNVNEIMWLFTQANP